MSTSETVTFEKGSCPCGNGHIAQHVTTQDNPWSTADVSYSIECQQCRSDWRLESLAPLLVLRSSETEYLATQRLEHVAFRDFSAASEQVVSEYFVHFAARTNKAEHAELERLNLTSMSYRQYLTHRREGGTAATASHGQRNKPWLLNQASGISRQSEIEDLLDRLDLAREANTSAASRVVKWRVA